MNDVREAFEQWVGVRVERLDVGYKDQHISNWWYAWQAA